MTMPLHWVQRRRQPQRKQQTPIVGRVAWWLGWEGWQASRQWTSLGEPYREAAVGVGERSRHRRPKEVALDQRRGGIVVVAVVVVVVVVMKRLVREAKKGRPKWMRGKVSSRKR